MNKIINPPIITKNKMYENHEFMDNFLVIIAIINDCDNKIIPIVIGCLNIMNIIEFIIKIVMSESSLNKILILGIKDRIFLFLKFKKITLNLIYKINIFIKLLKQC